MTLHIYGQLYQHSDCYVLATKNDLKAFAEQLLAACDGKSVSSNYFTADGEGYTVRVSVVEDSDLDVTRLPYTSDQSVDTRTSVKDAWQYFYSDRRATGGTVVPHPDEL